MPPRDTPLTPPSRNSLPWLRSRWHESHAAARGATLPRDWRWCQECRGGATDNSPEHPRYGRNRKIIRPRPRDNGWGSHGHHPDIARVEGQLYRHARDIGARVDNDREPSSRTHTATALAKDIRSFGARRVPSPRMNSPSTPAMANLSIRVSRAFSRLPCGENGLEHSLESQIVGAEDSGRHHPPDKELLGAAISPSCIPRRLRAQGLPRPRFL